MGTKAGKHATGKLSAVAVNRQNKPGRYADGGGLYLQVTQSGAKSWLFRFMLDGKAREMGLGSVGTIPLADARIKAAEARRKVKESRLDPIESRKETERQRLIALGNQRTFEECAREYYASLLPGWKNVKHGQQWINTLIEYAFPKIGALPVAQINTEAVLKVLNPIWTSKTETAQRVMQRIRTVLDYAKVLGYRNKSEENPALWQGNLDKVLAKPTKLKNVKHHAAMPWADVSAFVAKLADSGAGLTTALGLEFLILTATRTSEVLGARWSEFDLDDAIWEIPSSRMKAARPHRVPLSPRCVEILKAIQTAKLDPELVFASSKEGKPLSTMVFLMLLRRLKLTVTAHGFRSSFRDWASENTSFSFEVMEAALAHGKENKQTVGAYARSDLFLKRRKLMEQWAAFVTTPKSAGRVLPLKKNKRAA